MGTATQNRGVTAVKREDHLTAAMTIDMKRGRIRIHKALLHQLGDPQYIQLLVDPAGLAVAVRCIDTPVFGDCVHTIGKTRLHSPFSCEIYSQHFMSKLATLVPSMGENRLYRMSGEVIPAQKMAVFDLKALTDTES